MRMTVRRLGRWQRFDRGGRSLRSTQVRRGFRVGLERSFVTEKAPQLYGDVVIDRAGMSFLFGNAQFRQLVEDLVGLDFELASQLIDANLTHRTKIC